ncbi:MAG: response regulator [Calditrichaeota bacterium]|jgi:two-component system, response regulator, stage 0 sporulation protein F|nr:response regulator [Calditrichota bacterium]MBT7788718.1 response regulator [Calditrichota bacterium]
MAANFVLAVDDEKLTRELLAQALELLGFETRTAENGKIALDLLKQDVPELVITDIYMPEMNGIELLKEIRKFKENLPVILITGFDAEDARQAAKDFNANALLTKPFQIQQLKDVIDTLI